MFWVGNLALSVSASLSAMLSWVFWWNSTVELPELVGAESVVIELNTDYSLKGLSAAEITSLVAAWQCGANPRFGAWEHLDVGGWDWNSWDCWILGCYATEAGFVADRGVARPVAMTFDTAATYLIAVRKCGATITAWLRLASSSRSSGLAVTPSATCWPGRWGTLLCGRAA